MRPSCLLMYLLLACSNNESSSFNVIIMLFVPKGLFEEIIKFEADIVLKSEPKSISANALIVSGFIFAYSIYEILSPFTFK